MTGQKICVKCGEELADPAILNAVKHWIDDHPNADQLHDILTSTWVQVDCSDCSQTFFSPVSSGAGRIGAHAYCPDCDSEGIRSLIVQSLTPEELIEREVDPSEDDLDNRRVFGSEVDDEQ